MTDTIPTYAVIPTAGRPCLHDCVAAIRDQVDRVVLVANNGYSGFGVHDALVVHDLAPTPNISRWWNLGLDAIAARRTEAPETNRWNVLVINDDTVMDPGSVAVLTAGLRRIPPVRPDLAYPGDVDRLFRAPSPYRITGWCFALRGESGLRADEGLVWWCGDNDLDWQARQRGGTVAVPGVGHQHLHPNGYTVARPDLTEQAGRDMTRFVEKWGRPAW